MLRTQIVSDCHLEFYDSIGESWADRADPTDVDVLIVAGDLAAPPYLLPGLMTLCQEYPEVVFVAGNHEYYHADPEKVKAGVRNLEAKLDNLHFLDNEVWVHEGVKFIGTSLWFRPEPGNALYYKNFTDFVYIKPTGKTSWQWIYEENAKALAFLEKEHADADVIVTHHVPSNRTVHPRWANSDLNRFFICDMSPISQDNNRHRNWVFGHTHDCWDVTLGKTRLLCNPVGYPNEKRQAEGYKEKLVVEISPEAK
jgi:Icc-related predicted phosphoesterase